MEQARPDLHLHTQSVGGEGGEAEGGMGKNIWLFTRRILYGNLSANGTNIRNVREMFKLPNKATKTEVRDGVAIGF